MPASSEFERVSEYIERLEPEMIELQKELVRRPAIGPGSGGEGEKVRADYLKSLLEGWGLPVTEYRAPDRSVPCGYRPSIVARLNSRVQSPESEVSGGEFGTKPTLWIMTHLDVVPAGPRELWTHEPFEATVEDGKVYGRGTEDNQQEMVASCFAVKAMLDLGIAPERDVCLMMVADEETGSEFGVDWLLANHRLCGQDDLVVVPDVGNAEGTMLEIAEKSIAWVKFTVRGKQSHASAPKPGGNAHRAGANLIVRLDKALHEKYSRRDELFTPSESTIEPTKKNANVPNVNTIPGEDVFYFDCRMLPEYRLDDLLSDMRQVADGVAAEFGVTVKVETEQLAQAAPPTPADAPVVRMLGAAVEAVYGKKPFVKGVGGGTVAAFFRRRGIPAVVWGRYCGRAHNPDEYCLIENMKGNAMVYARMFLPRNRSGANHRDTENTESKK